MASSPARARCHRRTCPLLRVKGHQGQICLSVIDSHLGFPFVSATARGGGFDVFLVSAHASRIVKQWQSEHASSCRTPKRTPQARCEVSSEDCIKHRCKPVKSGYPLGNVNGQGGQAGSAEHLAATVNNHQVPSQYKPAALALRALLTQDGTQRLV